MKTSTLGVMVALGIAGLACASVLTSSQDESRSDDSAIALRVLGSESSWGLEFVEVTALLGDGRERVLGRTNAFGILRVAPEELGPDVKVLLFCREDRFCGALRTSDPSFGEYREHLIALAPFMVT